MDFRRHGVTCFIFNDVTGDWETASIAAVIPAEVAPQTNRQKILFVVFDADGRAVIVRLAAQPVGVNRAAGSAGDRSFVVHPHPAITRCRLIGQLKSADPELLLPEIVQSKISSDISAKDLEELVLVKASDRREMAGLPIET